MRVITGSARGRKLKTLEGGDIVRPTTDRVKEAMFSIIQFDIPDADVLDLFAGSGQLGIEALSRGAKSAVFVDRDINAYNTVKENLEITKLDGKAFVLNADSISYIKNSRNKYDIIILDPPYNKGIIDEVLPYAVASCKENSVIICESEFNEVLPEECGDFIKHKDYKYSKIKLTVYKHG
ncbi:MAG: 16S rRNA (guanine(966)-N(2))-methyltransferase RsmD [Ruminococcaceae bacterium]|nr:16S rRNA (guanine(966)-N(2))-methyltransferase RsmD [Oscillospiraceae bacterium]